MKTHSLLIGFPGYPLDPKVLLPDWHLAAVGGALLDAGHQTRICDFGTVDMLDRLFPEECREPARRLVAEFRGGARGFVQYLQTYWRMLGIDRKFSERQIQVCQEVAETLCAAKPLDFVGLKLGAPEDWHPTNIIATRIRGVRPEVKIIAFGPLVERYGKRLLDMCPAFDAVSIGDPERTVPEWAERVSDAARWVEVPNLVCRAAGRAAPKKFAAFGEMPGPAYHCDVYPALQDDEKLKVFVVEDCRGCPGTCYGCPDAARMGGVRVKPVSRVRDEVRHLLDVHGARAFHFRGEGAPWGHVTAIARMVEVLGDPSEASPVRYSRQARIAAAVPSTFQLLNDSGCAAMSFRVDTGSQRLLEDHYGHEFGVTQAEETLGACKSAGIFTVIGMTYPCPGDDDHTAAETLRFIERSRPHAALFRVPDVLPGTAWHAMPSAFGFKMDANRHVDDALRSGTRFPLPPGRWKAPAFGVGQLSPSEVVDAHERMVAAVERVGASTFITEECGLVARFMGYAGREGELANRIRFGLCAGDLADISSLVAAFNGAARAPAQEARRGLLHPYTPLALAVGN